MMVRSSKRLDAISGA